MNLRPGDKAPLFTLESDGGKKISLEDLVGKKVVLYFYPKDDTPGCTVQACEYRDLMKRFKSKKIIVLGISRDSLEEHKKFKKKYGLNFPLLSDADHEVHEKYGAWGEKKLYGKKMMGPFRTTVVIDEGGRILSWAGKVAAQGNAEKTLEILQKTP